MEPMPPQPWEDETPDTTLVGLIGRGIGPSRTPVMHEAEAARLGHRLIYRLMDVDEMPGTPGIGELVRAAEISRFAGLNITYPYKIDVIGELDSLSDSAQAVGAVNTVVFRDGKRFGHNTDLWGFAESFRRCMADAPRSRVLLIGAGGAGGAVAHALADCGVRTLVVADTAPERAEDLSERLRRNRPGITVETVTDKEAVAGSFDGVVNATPMGMAKLPGSPFPTDRLHQGMWVADIVYFPLETEFLQAARAAGCRTMSGATMAVFQAVRAFELFTGLRPDFDEMRAAFDSRGEV